jgi:hypothetical protein
MKIFIPTNRGPYEQLTYDRIPEEYRAMYGVQLLVNDKELSTQLRDAGYSVCTHGAGPGISPSRQWAIDNSSDDKLLMLDDDLANWAYRVAGTTSYKKDENGQSFRNAFAVVDSLLDRVAHSGIGHRQFANNQPLVAPNGRIMRALAYNLNVVRAQNIRITLPLMQDFEMNLKLLTSGYSSLNYYGVVQDHYRSNAPGGCSNIRTVELLEHCARELQRMFPDFVTLTQKDGWDIGKRWDVSVRWQKAYRSSKA